MEFTPDAKLKFHVQDYARTPAIEGVRVELLSRHADDGGSMTELLRLTDGQALGDFTVRQVNYSEMAPGAIKAFHLHARQTDIWYVPPSDTMLMLLIDVRKGSRTEGQQQRLVLGNGTSKLVIVPPGVAHGVRNIGAAPGRIVYFTDVHFSDKPAECDEGRLPWDFAGAGVWEITRG